MANIIKIKRGLKTNLDDLILQEGELAVLLDTQELYIGDNDGNTKPVEIGTKVVNVQDRDTAIAQSKINPNNIYIWS